MVQMQLDLVGGNRKVCTMCGMEFIPSNTEDAALHRKFHAINLGGVDFTKPAIERFRKHQIWTGAEGSFVAVIGRRDALTVRNKANEVLRVVNTELSAVPIPEAELWGPAARTLSADTPPKGPTAINTNEFDLPLVDRFKVYLYLRGNKCVGMCLVERIWAAFTVLQQPNTPEATCQLPTTPRSSSISISTVPDPAVLGVSRIWTSNKCRKQGIATRLLELARSDFLYGLTVEKERMAFSQPTESGGSLARRWFGSQAGWHVYID